jgi:hypothetical protein
LAPGLAGALWLSFVLYIVVLFFAIFLCVLTGPSCLSWCVSGLSSLTQLRWLCLRWLDDLPLQALAPLTGLVALQLKAISRPPGR